MSPQRTPLWGWCASLLRRSGRVWLYSNGWRGRVFWFIEWGLPLLICCGRELLISRQRSFWTTIPAPNRQKNEPPPRSSWSCKRSITSLLLQESRLIIWGKPSIGLSTIATACSCTSLRIWGLLCSSPLHLQTHHSAFDLIIISSLPGYYALSPFRLSICLREKRGRNACYVWGVLKRI